MGTLKLSNSSGNFVALEPPSSIASDVTLTLPNTDGDANQYLQTNGSGALSWATITDDAGAEWTDATKQLPSGSDEVVFTGIPSNAKEVIINMESVSWTTGSNIQVQLGTSSGLVGGSSYFHSYAYIQNAGSPTVNRVGSDAFVFGIWTSASHAVSGSIRITNIYDNNWSFTGALHTTLDNTQNHVQGFLDIGGTLERVAIQNRAGNNFDGGAINIHYITT